MIVLLKKVKKLLYPSGVESVTPLFFLRSYTPRWTPPRACGGQRRQWGGGGHDYEIIRLGC